MVIALAIHPFCGQRFRLRRKRHGVQGLAGSSGSTFFELEHPRGYLFRVPIEWTERVVRPSPGVVDGRALRVSFALLLELSRLVEALERPSFGAEVGQRDAHSQEPSQPNESTRIQQGDGDSASLRQAPGADLEAGQLRPADASRRGHQPGGV